MKSYFFKLLPYIQDYYILITFLVISCLIFTCLFFVYLRKKHQKRMRVFSEEMESKSQLSKQDQDWIYEILEQTKYYEPSIFLNDIRTFEKVIEKYKRLQIEKDNLGIKYLPQLRKNLHFSLKNQTIPFLNTKQLYSSLNLTGYFLVGLQYLECTVQVLSIYEDEFWITAPTKNNKAIKLEEKNITFIYQENDNKSKKFTCNISYQVTTPRPAIVLKHTENIKTVFSRKVPRKKLKVNVQLYSNQVQPIEAISYDLSSKGMSVISSKLNSKIKIGDYIKTKFQKEGKELEIYSEIIKIRTPSLTSKYVHLRFHGSFMVSDTVIPMNMI